MAMMSSAAEYAMRKEDTTSMCVEVDMFLHVNDQLRGGGGTGGAGGGEEVKRRVPVRFGPEGAHGSISILTKLICNITG